MRSSVNAHAEGLRAYFVAHEGQKVLDLDIVKNNFDYGAHQETGGAYGRKRPSLVYHGHYCGARSGYNQVRRQYELRGHTRPLIALTMTAYGSNSRYQ